MSEQGALIPEPDRAVAAWQKSAISARARGNFEAERHFLDRLALAERAPVNIGDTCCGACPAGTCYVDQVTGA